MKTNLNILPLKNETMKRITTLLLSCLVSTGPLLAQQGVTQCGTPTGIFAMYKNESLWI